MTPENIYPSDLTDEEWAVVEECLHREEEIGAGRPLEVDLRRVWDAILYLTQQPPAESRWVEGTD